MLDIDDIADVIAGAVREATAPLLQRIDALEKHEILTPPFWEQVTERVAKSIQAGPQGEPGAIDMFAVEAMLDEKVVAAVAALPSAERGERGEPGIDGQAGEKGADGAPGEPGPDGKDGIGLADALIDKDGHLVVTTTDGRTKALGSVIGKGGVDGRDGKDGETFTLDDFDVIPVDERTIKLCFTRGDVMHSFELAFPVVLDRGVFKVDSDYVTGDAVTWAGSLWIAQRDNPGKPDTADGGWRLAVKRGRDGKDAAK